MRVVWWCCSLCCCHIQSISDAFCINQQFWSSFSAFIMQCLCTQTYANIVDAYWEMYVMNYSRFSSFWSTHRCCSSYNSIIIAAAQFFFFILAWRESTWWEWMGWWHSRGRLNGHLYVVLMYKMLVLNKLTGKNVMSVWTKCPAIGLMSAWDINIFEVCII